MSQVVLDIPDDILSALKLSPEDTGATLAAMKFFELGKLSSGAAPRLAGVSRVVFLTQLADFGDVTFDHSREDLEREARLS